MIIFNLQDKEPWTIEKKLKTKNLKKILVKLNQSLQMHLQVTQQVILVNKQYIFFKKTKN